MPMRMEMTIRSTRKTAKYPPIIVMERLISAARVGRYRAVYLERTEPAI